MADIQTFKRSNDLRYHASCTVQQTTQPERQTSGVQGRGWDLHDDAFSLTRTQQQTSKRFCLLLCPPKGDIQSLHGPTYMYFKSVKLILRNIPNLLYTTSCILVLHLL